MVFFVFFLWLYIIILISLIRNISLLLNDKYSQFNVKVEVRNKDYKQSGILKWNTVNLMCTTYIDF